MKKRLLNQGCEKDCIPALPLHDSEISTYITSKMGLKQKRNKATLIIKSYLITGIYIIRSMRGKKNLLPLKSIIKL